MKNNYLCLLLTIVLALSLGAMIHATALGAEKGLLEILRDNGIITQQQYEELKKGAAKEPMIDTKGKLEIKSADDQFKFQIGGRIHADGAWYSIDKQDLGDGTELRRVHLDTSGTLWKDWHFTGQFDFANNDVSVRDAYLSYSELRLVTFKAGNFKVPHSLEVMMNNNWTTFMETGLPKALTIGRRIGLGVDAHGDLWSIAAMGFGEGVSNSGVDEESGVAGRITLSPVHQKTKVIHLGTWAALRDLTDTAELRFHERPESHVTSVRLVDTGTISNVEDSIHYGFEGAGIYGPFSIQGEYITVDVGRESGFSDVGFDGWYVYGSWIVTGESRSYSVKKGVFGEIKPKRNFSLEKGGKGALELAVRYSTIDLNDGPIDGGDMDNWTMGVNWYPNPNIRFCFNYITVDSEKAGVSDDPHVFQVRAQVVF